MPEEKTKVIVNGQVHEATKVPVRSAEERWSDYILEDGTVVRLKVVATEVARIDGMYEPDGTPIYNVKTSAVISVSAPDGLKQIPGGN